MKEVKPEINKSIKDSNGKEKNVFIILFSIVLGIF